MIEAAISWFAHAGRDLPWRRPERTPWGVLVSEIMLQQTPVARVLPSWERWMERWPTPAHLAAASPADVLRAWDRLGYPRRALRLQEAARAIVTRHGGIVPSDETELRALPGIGEYTAAAVAAFAFGRRSVVIDTNVRRVEARLVAGQALPAPSLTASERDRARALVPADTAESAAWNAAVMEIGALVCTARAAHCERCPIAPFCAYFAAGRPAPPAGAKRRRQAFQGTDRQARGRIMADLRHADAPQPRARLALTWPDDPEQFTRALDSLVADGLVAQDRSGAYSLPS